MKNSQKRTKKHYWAQKLSARVQEVRISTFGPRGRARFARALGLSPSTYNYYEKGRVPPMPILLKVSEIAGIDLRWLLTGELPQGFIGRTLSADHARILARMGALLPRRAEATAALNALLDLLESQPKPLDEPGARPVPTVSAKVKQPHSIRIPVLGRTAAGVPQFWKRSRESVDFMHSVLTPQLRTGPTQEATLASPDGMVSEPSAEPVYLVQLATPIRVGKLEITEFLECLKLADHGTDVFALRVDGDSMHPALSHGDFIVVSPSESVQAGRTAVVQLRNQIGVTCKLFYKDKGLVRLIPINEQFQPTKHPVGELVWALPVLYRVRLRGV